jgi:subtilisin family serine protease
MGDRPAWSSQFESDAIREIRTLGPLASITREWAWGESKGEGVNVAVIDSGIDPEHPLLDGSVTRGVVVVPDGEIDNKYQVEDDDPPRDLFGHGTACAGIVHAIAPQAEICSVRVLGMDLTGKALQFAEGLRWAIENGFEVINLSLSTSHGQYFGIFHKLADEAYFNNAILVSAANNLPLPSFPSLYSSVVSVAAHEGQDPTTYYYNPSPPVEFGAPGINIEVAWLDRGTSIITGNSFAAPHMAGLVARIMAKHPELTPFQIKTVLYACASNIQRA